MKNTIPISDNQKAFIANAIFRSVSQDMPEMIDENHLTTSLGSGLFRWNFIIRELSDAFDAEFEMALQPRGAWKLPLLRDTVSNLSFSIMTERTFRRLQKARSEHIHYLEALVCNNKVRRPIEGQFCIPGFEHSRDSSILEELRTCLLSSFSGIVEEHVLVLFDYDYSYVTSARAVLLTPKLEVALSEDWTRFLKNTFVSHNSVLVEMQEVAEPFVKLKPEFEPNNDITTEKREISGDGETDY